MPHINILGTFILIVIGYLIGSISPAIIISRKRFKTDVRQHYSKNAGATNSTRVMGKKWGAVVVVIDGFKPIITVLIAWGFTFITIANPDYHNLFSESYIYFSGLAAVIGHCWPIYFGFRGGKGAASSLGLLLIINPIYFAVALASWWILLYLWRMASLSSVLMVGFAFVISWIPNMPLNAYVWPHDDQYCIINIIIFLTWLIVVLRHSSNLIRIARGTERKVTIFDRKKKK
ncbi:glycerol-3-phosphate 1-O-acyltransferase PlsY [Spiroplasma platyhelix]|uniref:Glycerol-3-phosphate acyltransferase n=1 Tax=Spiroplasma platyhelix PALS-1 TaxID=1276218 RepID=A0A846U4K2_9MOLU|nr:glycerol-3-phosphate 1-O-acyltransferase PlsY [Spiroplasma platyhelix]MBE4704016.1 Glycerol-3-phosphate acyltransferase [Spiroplasma platyhelix PALS-1]NKE38387.1 glycerol-3-phosphate 1-O-acyltransferase PlsY [Spiroplasma platyhelix PALS-1]UJB29274.1 glycerol-3-phosphate acyltransferase PlsY [Spiroplasma platyhelix PALS-1]